ncbi:MAG: hypothetical protein IGQ45_09125 [Cyanobacterium sp. T60_A2020_053]|nr:hypothetical protein [Cyanobacterium sp. T60_A2020_053]
MENILLQQLGFLYGKTGILPVFLEKPEKIVPAPSKQLYKSEIVRVGNRQ